MWNTWFVLKIHFIKNQPFYHFPAIPDLRHTLMLCFKKKLFHTSPSLWYLRIYLPFVISFQSVLQTYRVGDLSFQEAAMGHLQEGHCVLQHREPPFINSNSVRPSVRPSVIIGAYLSSQVPVLFPLLLYGFSRANVTILMRLI